ncbi:MAG: hypothetical protein BWY67_01703 [Bacteroidetes bacterium ADurb.Bin397]|nr:MAG: hypothetical protein BWY67_01703 [Bacteroidetes bacterium ADurb.Bin397]
MRSVPVSAACFISSESGFINTETRSPAAFNSPIIFFKSDFCSMVFQPALDVNTSGGSGTSVTCSGLVASTSFMNSGEGYPSILNSVVTTFFSSTTSLYRICLSSGRGCTVMPSAPKRSQSIAT